MYGDHKWNWQGTSSCIRWELPETRKEICSEKRKKITSSTRDSYYIFGGRSGVANFIAKNLLIY
jgi:hypothetical protein